MTDRSFDIQYSLSGLGVRPNIPSFCGGEHQFTPDDVYLIYSDPP